MPEREDARRALPHVLESLDRQLSRFERRAFYAAALGSVLLHAAILSLPLGSAVKGRGASSPEPASTIRALLRPEEVEPVRVVEAPPRPVAAQPPQPVLDPPAPAAEPARSKEPNPAATAGTTHESSSSPSIPATFYDPAALTEKPKPLEEPRVDLLARMLVRAGVVHLILYISESGSVDRVEIDSATLPPGVAERAAAIFAMVPFAPGRIDGRAVKTRVRVIVGAEQRPRED